MGRRLTAAVLILSVAACTSIGPSTVTQDRIDYASAIGESWKQQTLLNIVKLRYADVPIFLEVAQVVAGYQLESTIGGGFTAGNFNAVAPIGPFARSGSVTASGSYTDRPTVIYQPLTGVDFLTRLMTPIPASSLLFLLQSGYEADRVMPIMLDSINGIYNESTYYGRPADPRFVRLVRLMREIQLAGIQIRIERPKGGPESSVLVFGPSKDPQIVAKSQEIRNLLGLKPNLSQVQVHYGGYSGKDNEIDMITRSMLQIMFEFAAVVQVPESDVAEGKTAPATEAWQPQSGRTMRILTGTAPPKHAFVAVQYDNRWFWIADTDIQSKTTFEIVILLFSIADTGVKGSTPIVTIPTNQ
jgi:hypothetical protein